MRLTVGRPSGRKDVDLGLDDAYGLTVRAGDFEIEGVSGGSKDVDVLIGRAGRTVATCVPGKGRVDDALQNEVIHGTDRLRSFPYFTPKARFAQMVETGSISGGGYFAVAGAIPAPQNGTSANAA